MTQQLTRMRYLNYRSDVKERMQCFNTQYPLPITSPRQEATNFHALLEREEITRISTIEFLWEAKVFPELRGALVFGDPESKPLLHLPSALIGYEGFEPRYTKDVLQRLGIPDFVFPGISAQANETFSREQGGKYAIVLYRDSHGWDWRKVV